MSGDREERIRQRAHQIWLSEGQPDGAAERHWEYAAQQIDAELSAAPVNVTKKAPAKKPAASKKTPTKK